MWRLEFIEDKSQANQNPNPDRYCHFVGGTNSYSHRHRFQLADTDQNRWPDGHPDRDHRTYQDRYANRDRNFGGVMPGKPAPA